MLCFWLFNLIAVIPFICPKFRDVAQYISSGYLQLVALPLISVYSSIIGETAEERAKEDHEAIMNEIETLNEIQVEIKELLKIVHDRFDEK